MAQQPCVATIVSSLQTCRKKRNLELAKHAHLHVANYGLEMERTVGNFMVPMFVECGSVPDAEQVFFTLFHRNEHSWTSLISGYFECGQSDHAFNLYDKMQEDRVHPTSYTLTVLLRACAKAKDMLSGQRVHLQIRQSGLDTDPFVNNTLVHMYARCGALAEAREVFDKLPIRDLVSWNVLITGYAENGLGQEVLGCFNEMQLEDVTPDAVTFVCSLKACAIIAAIDRGREIHAEFAALNGYEENVILGNALVDMYAKCGSLLEAQMIFDRLPIRNVVSWNAIIAAYLENRLCLGALKCYNHMQLEGIYPNAITFISVLRSCSSMAAIDKGRVIHNEIAQKGFDKHLIVGNTLIDMYVKCGSLVEARDVFDKLPVQDVVSWTSLIGGYTAHGSGQEALKCFDQMQLEGTSPDFVTFASVLKACGNIGAIDKGRKIHVQVVRKGYAKVLLVSNALIDMYVKCGFFAEAQEVFTNLLVRDIASWTAILAGYADHGFAQEALKCFEQMQQEGIRPDAVTYVCSLKACANMGAIDRGRTMHNEISRQGLLNDLFIGSSLVDMYVKCGSLLEAQNVFDKLLVRDVVLWNSLITGYAESGLRVLVLKCFEQMQLETICPNAATFVCVFKVCGTIVEGRKIHAEAVQNGLETDPFIGNSLVDMYGKFGSLVEAQEVFEKMPVQEVVAWNALISGYVENGHGEQALKCFDEAHHGGISLNDATFIPSIKACCCIGALEKGRNIHAEIIQRGFGGELSISTTLVDMYAKGGSLLEAREVFDKMAVRDVVSWTAMIAGYAEYGSDEEALDCFIQMQLDGVPPDAITLLCSLLACTSIGAIDKGREIHKEIIQRGFEIEISVATALIDMYFKGGSLSEAQEVFEKLPVRDVVSWNAMIRGYGMNYKCNLALQCFREMQGQGMKPDAMTFTGLLTACSRATLVLLGHECFEAMIQRYRILPIVDHYTCMVDLLARSGQLYEAEKLLQTPFCFPSQEAWTAVLSACTIYNDIEVGLRCFHQLVLMNPENSAPYVLMTSIYARSGRCDDANKIDELRKHAGARKKPARSPIEIYEEL